VIHIQTEIKPYSICQTGSFSSRVRGAWCPFAQMVKYGRCYWHKCHSKCAQLYTSEKLWTI